MPRNRRSSSRCDVHIVGEFKLRSNPAVSFLGITRDFSCGGFSFESQVSDLSPGDNLAIRFKHHDSDLVLSTQGEIVWKRNTDKFICLMGIKFTDITKSVNSMILKIVSGAGNVPVDLFLSGTGTRDRKVKAAETGQANDNAAAYTEPESGNKKSLSILLAVTAVAVFILSLPAQHDNLMKGITTPGPDSVKFMSDPDNEKNRLLSQTDNEPLIGLVKETSSKPSQETGMAVPEGDETEQPGLPHTDIADPDNPGYYVQVGSWKNPDYAHETRDRLIRDYPDAYIVVEKDFHVIRIPGIMTKIEGDKIIEEIEDTYNLIPLLALKRK